MSEASDEDGAGDENGTDTEETQDDGGGGGGGSIVSAVEYEEGKI